MNIYDIAAEAKTSISSVSRVLNNKGNVNLEIRKRVEEVLKKYDYKPSAIARGLVSKTMKSIAILTVDVRVTHYARMIYVIEQEFSNRGYNVTVCNTGVSIEKCKKYMEILSEKQVDGIVLIGSIFNELINYPDITSKIKNIPVIVANGKVNLPDFYSVQVDDAKGIRAAVDYLYDKGHRELVYVYDLETDSGRAKRQGFLEAMKLHDIPEAEKRVISSKHGLEGGRKAAEILCSSGISFTGVVCGEDITAIGLMKGLKKQGFSIPDQVVITGCNNSPDSLICEPELTTIDNKPELLGGLCAQLLQEVLEGKMSASNLAIQPELITRGTT
ncbi:LacI family DNA-binding transcriptional regulator [Lacrimispora celerecrescens]|uniref:LacI family transcriptional regulator n=1 Tax=[Clostridium] celerecrescens 18A TaxID=1286362 RepID=A0A2M8Z1M4_9FIRM|nr:LacI family DNA-binding transcriptional regulator [Lacrimispora celerecrescens]PJJ27341.1 LacI family transcriptional regulator [[Clostridium] celerecrescens 18A]